VKVNERVQVELSAFPASSVQEGSTESTSLNQRGLQAALATAGTSTVEVLHAFDDDVFVINSFSEPLSTRAR